MSKLLIVILLCGLAIPAVVRAGSSPELGRLLTTPEERARLETFRHHRTPEALSPDSEVSSEVAEENSDLPGEARVYTLKGLVRRPDGRHVVWLNQGNTLAGPTTAEGAYVEVNNTGRGGVLIRLPGNAGRVVLKPGQSYDAATGKLYDIIEKGPAQASEVTKKVDLDVATTEEQKVENSPPRGPGTGNPAGGNAAMGKK
jgi:hypothetical protein